MKKMTEKEVCHEILFWLDGNWWDMLENTKIYLTDDDYVSFHFENDNHTMGWDYIFSIGSIIEKKEVYKKDWFYSSRQAFSQLVVPILTRISLSKKMFDIVRNGKWKSYD